MAIIVQGVGRKGTSGERRVEEALRRHLSDDCLVWYDIPVGKGHRRYPDFIVLHPQHGLLFLEVKDWVGSTFKHITSTSAQLLTDKGLVTKPNPIEQVRQCAQATVNHLLLDKTLRQEGKWAGNLKFPYAYGVVFTKITRKSIHSAIPDEARATVLPDAQVLYQEDLRDDVSSTNFESQLVAMFSHQFGLPVAAADINRVRGVLYPELRVDLAAVQSNLFDEPDDIGLQAAFKTPEGGFDVMRVMDLQQEQLARNLGTGHRVIHGVAGSGKTLILLYRCQYLASILTKPILVLCFNITLAAKLRTVMTLKGLADKVQVVHFHAWCAQQLKQHQIPVMDGKEEIYNRQVTTMLQAVESGAISREQYGAVMIDEGHDFEAPWLKEVVKMVDVEEGHLLLLYDDAQSIYRSGGLNFTLSSVGIKAQGRTSILKVNYRNTREILQFAYEFASEYLQSQDSSDEDHIPLVLPESGGVSGLVPSFHRLASFSEEVTQATQNVLAWQKEGIELAKIAILVVTLEQAKPLQAALKQAGVATQLLTESKTKKAYQPDDNSVAIMALQSSKGLEFSHVVVVGVGSLAPEAKRIAQDAKVLYVGMTRAQKVLVVTGSISAQDQVKQRGVFVHKLQKQATTLAS